MGICSSCLGRREDNLSDDDEQSRLLFEDAIINHYGSFGEQNTGTITVDPQEVQRETEALQKVVAQTSNHLVDIFAMVPQNMALAPTLPAHAARMTRYQDVLSKLSANEQQRPAQHVSADSTPNVSDGWTSEGDDADEINVHALVKSEQLGPLVGGFADADSVD
ncbi:late endosomal/lysosomal adaptor and MAPK and MTOR activator-domain-containing protein [Calycina marina]|uniref:Late endosomal/lysosomal adaptor and MAPK and MTOR activator-domain-containing protein n=1 Tax=Calycina marina TaxID=1763456 RepID=A0A9P8CAT5_9HELO|nr:late endosomal/lysosomal adaptor and MAPK and MTOR activator-domain-containing protein [Calycina marina]